MNAYLSGLCGKYISCYTDNISYIQQLLKYRIVKGLILIRADVVTAKVDLYPAGRVLYFSK